MKVPHKLVSFLKEQRDFLIATHINPEADALGSSLALSMALNTLGKNTLLYDRDGVPAFYRFLPGQEKFLQDLSHIKTSDLTLLLLDCNTPERAGIEGSSFSHSAVIDHHETETDFGEIRWVEPYSAATGIMVFHLIKKLGIDITKDMAINLYAAIAIDTGSFRFTNTTAEVLHIAAELVRAGADPSFISSNLYETWSRGRFQLLIQALDTLDVRDHVAFTFVTREMFKETGTGPEDTENFSSFPRVMKDIRICAFFRETDDNEWKVSLRSKGDINVATIAKSFDGGGHKNAAGFTIRAPLESAKETLVKMLTRTGKS